ncbi:MAG TPA: hypothetical protein VFZ98_09040 [Vicinamibacterales bacterium]
MIRAVLSKTWPALAIGAAFGVAAMLVYPGGTPLDAATVGYSLSRNFLSDLGTTVAFNGRSNQPGALLFVLSLGTLILGFSAFLLRTARLLSGPARPWGRAAVAIGSLVMAAFLAVALTPENRFWTAHVFFTCWAFRIFPVVPALLAVATLKDRRFPRHVGMMWVLLACVVAVYVGVLEMGPEPDTPHGLTIQVLAQKLVTVVAVLFVAYQSYQANRIRLASEPDALTVDR